jgi:hypothetical protein
MTVADLIKELSALDQGLEVFYKRRQGFNPLSPSVDGHDDLSFVNFAITRTLMANDTDVVILGFDTNNIA